MRFALIATAVAGAVVTPLLASAAGPQMDGHEFLSAVRCAAYENVVGDDAGFGEVRYRLNAEARRQPEETAARARLEVAKITRQAAEIERPADRAMLSQAREQACASRVGSDAA